MNLETPYVKLGSLTRCIQRMEKRKNSRVITKNLNLFLKWIDQSENKIENISKLFEFLRRRYKIFWTDKRIRYIFDSYKLYKLTELELDALKKERKLYKLCNELISDLENSFKGIKYKELNYIEFLAGYDSIYFYIKNSDLKNEEKNSWVDSWKNSDFFEENPTLWCAFCLGRFYSFMAEKEFKETKNLALYKNSISWLTHLNAGSLLRVFKQACNKGSLIGNLIRNNSKSESSVFSIPYTIPYRSIRLEIEKIFLDSKINKGKIQRDYLQFVFNAGFFTLKKAQNIKIKTSELLELANLKNDTKNIVNYYLGKIFHVYSSKELNLLKTRSFRNISKKIQKPSFEDIPVIMNYLYKINIRIFMKKLQNAKRGKNIEFFKKMGSLFYEYLPYLNYHMFIVKTWIENYPGNFKHHNKKYENFISFIIGFHTKKIKKGEKN